MEYELQSQSDDWKLKVEEAELEELEAWLLEKRETAPSPELA